MSTASDARRDERAIRKIKRLVVRVVEGGRIRPGLLLNEVATAINHATVRHASEKAGCSTD